MGEFKADRVHFRTTKRTAIGLSFLFALGLHAVFLSLPVILEPPGAPVNEVRIELEFSRATPEPPPGPVPLPVPDTPVPKPGQISAPTEEVANQESDTPKEQVTAKADSEGIDVAPAYARKPFEQMDELEKQRLARSLLGRQFIKEDSPTDRLFGRPLVMDGTGTVSGFQIPARQSMITMLDKPLPDLPFAYQEGLVYFAYEPGVKGDLQRFWDLITPEIAFRTKYGTEVRCKWILIIGGCAWK